ncbi:MAG: hypothetical protein QM817_03625 [Archangium sp.]
MPLEAISTGATHEATHVEDAGGISPSGAEGTHATNSAESYAESLRDANGAEAPFDLFKALGELFSGGKGGDANSFDLGTLLASIFNSAGVSEDGKINLVDEDSGGGHQSSVGKGADVGEMSNLLNPGPPPRAMSGPDNPNLRQDHVGVRKEVEVKGEVGDKNFKLEGRAKAEAHAEANSYSETFNDGKNVHARVGADASVGASAEVEGKIKTPVAQLDGKATISAEAYARAQAEAHAGMDGVGASAKAQHGVLTSSTNSTNLSVANGLIEGHGDAHAEAGAAGQAIAKTEFSYKPPTAVATGKAEAFAGARAGFVAKGGMGGIQGGVGVEVWAGAGAKIEGTASYKKGHLGFDFSIGASVGVGFKINIKVDIDLKKAAKTFGDILTFMGGGAIFGAIGKMFGGGKGDGSHASKAISDAVKQATSMIKQPGRESTPEAPKADANDEAAREADESHEAERDAETTHEAEEFNDAVETTPEAVEA